MSARIRCADRYEARKLASLIYNDADRETCVTRILNVVKNEVVISIKDGSAHSILLGDEAEAERFADFCQSVLERSHAITGVSALEERVDISKG